MDHEIEYLRGFRDMICTWSRLSFTAEDLEDRLQSTCRLCRGGGTDEEQRFLAGQRDALRDLLQVVANFNATKERQ